MNEIKFLRELQICENIVKLKSVYHTNDLSSGYTTISLVLIYAKYGSLNKYLNKNEKFAEEQLRLIMA